MTTIAPRYDLDEFARRGQEVYERVVRPGLRPEDDGKFVAVDIETADYEVDVSDYQAVERLLARLPTAQVWLARAGQATAYRLGGGTADGRTE